VKEEEGERIMSRWITVAGALALSAAAAFTTFAGPQAGPGGPRRGGGPPELRLLDLTEAQRTAFQELMKQQREAARPLMEQQRELHQKLREALAADPVNENQVGQIVVESHRLRERMKAGHEKATAQFESLLTAEQKQLWAKIRASREKERGAFGDGGPTPGGFLLPGPPIEPPFER
jgi:Spy/CpxP family protein refolding chaperone